MRTRAFVSGLVAAAVLVVPSAAGGGVNPQIAGLQVGLRSWGYYHGAIDGIAGPQTSSAVRRFQRRARLTVDGIAGPRTRRALGRVGRPLFGRRLLERGSHGWDVAVLQFVLRRRGASPGIVDGYYGPETKRAVRRFQRRARLATDGVAGPHTLARLGAPRLTTPTATSVRAASRRYVRRSINRWSAHYGVSAPLARALAWMESGFQPDVVSPVGAWGVMQVTPATWRYVETVLLGRNVPRTTDGNIRVGVAYLDHVLHEFDWNERRALAAYYAGPAAVHRWGIGPRARLFVRTVLALEGGV